LFNVLRNEISLVGVRPIARAEAASYSREIERYNAAKPGPTSLWQVSGPSDIPLRAARGLMSETGLSGSTSLSSLRRSRRGSFGVAAH
jgi:lipopolysaccharide/colanic/teichoic acid biosynthesis glycosyltransferase